MFIWLAGVLVCFPCFKPLCVCLIVDCCLWDEEVKNKRWKKHIHRRERVETIWNELKSEMQEGGHHSCRIVVAIAILNAFAQFPRINTDSENKKCARHIVCAITKTRKKESLLHTNPALEKLQKRDVKKTDKRLCTAIVWNANTKMQAKWNANENEVIFYFIQQQSKSTIVSIVRIGRAATVIIVSFMYTSDIGQHLSIQCFLLLFLNRKNTHLMTDLKRMAIKLMNDRCGTFDWQVGWKMHTVLSSSSCMKHWKCVVIFTQQI